MNLNEKKILEAGLTQGLVAWYPLKIDARGYHPLPEKEEVTGAILSGINDHGYFFPGNIYNVINTNNFLNSVNGLFCSSDVQFTVSVWFKWVLSPTIGGDRHSHCILGQSGGIGSSATFNIHCTSEVWDNDNGGEITELYKVGVSIRGFNSVASTIQVNTGNWYHVVVTWDGATAKFYMDNTFIRNLLVGSADIQTYTFGIGNRAGDVAYDSGNEHDFEGNVYDVRVYNKVLSEKERGLLYTLSSPSGVGSLLMKHDQSDLYLTGQFKEI